MWDGGFALSFLLVLGFASKAERVQYKRGNHNDNRYNLEVSHDLTSFALVASEAKSQAPSVILPAGSTELQNHYIMQKRFPSNDLSA